MPADETNLPEGTDHIINGAGITDDETEAAGGAAKPGKDAGAATGGAFFDKIEDWRAQGYDKARDYAVQGKDKATGAIDELLKTINDAAGQVDQKIGSQYGDYARRASEGLGSFNEALKGKDVDELFADARDLVAKAPAVAIGAAAALGFVVARLAKAGMETAAETTTGKSKTKPKSDA
ncbi:hypothetical protein [Sphingomonas bacterium]|uniref:hypothetical protein n=1 Tax=Sphingomonas bacterium TaxID=1895847 RepID=UPI001576D10E|nr:hypothetical protein [Sphingomonas bacterium]